MKEMSVDLASSDDLAAFDQLTAFLGQTQSLLVAYSGGVDSTLLAYGAHLALGSQAVMVTAISPSLAAEDRARAQEIAQSFGWTHLESHTQELERPAYRANGPDRCFHCKTELFQHLLQLLSLIHISEPTRPY